MKVPRKVRWLVLLGLVPLAAAAQWSPARPIRMVVGFPSGGPIDTVARMLAPHFLEGLGQQVIVDPGKVNFSSSGAGGIPHLAGELLNIAARIKTVHVPYKGTAPAFSALLAGEVQFAVSAVISGLQHISLRCGRGSSHKASSPSAARLPPSRRS